MDGGAVCGNQAAEMGGGLRSQDATTTLEKCFITNNRAVGQGGGICIPWADFSMKGGLVAANNSDVGGGGIYFSTSAEDNIKQFHLEGGAVSANESGVEGGGIRIDTGYMEIIAKDGSLIYITNNKGNKNGTDWGGGGIFISDNSGRVKIYRTLITENKADGLAADWANALQDGSSVWMWQTARQSMEIPRTAHICPAPVVPNIRTMTRRTVRSSWKAGTFRMSFLRWAVISVREC